jgi:16S rRNA processing protein RimM
MVKEFLEAGELVGTHGVSGELRLNPWCDTPGFLAGFSTLFWDAKGQKPVRVLVCRPHGNIALLRLEGVDSVEAAAALRGRLLYLRRADAALRDDQYFVAELLGCRVLDADSGRCYGLLSDVSRTGANDVWHVTDEAGAERLLPAVPSMVVHTDVAAGVVKIRPVEGIFT